MRNYYAVESIRGQTDAVYAFRSPDDRAVWIADDPRRYRLYADDTRIRRLPRPHGWTWVSWVSGRMLAARLFWSDGQWEEAES